MFRDAEPGGLPALLRHLPPLDESWLSYCLSAVNYVLWGLVGCVTSLSVRPRRSGASPRVSGGAIVLIWRCCQYQGMQSAAPSRGAGGSCCQVGVPVSPAMCSSRCTALLLAVKLVPCLELRTRPRSLLVWGPSALLDGRWVKCVLVCCRRWDL